MALARRRGLDLESSRAPYRSFLGDLVALESALPPRAGRPHATVRRRLETSFNGVALSASSELVERLRALPYVAGVFPDDSVHATTTLAQSVKKIRADSLRKVFGVIGEGIDVSIVDTGIDYTHPALGGCFDPRAG